MPKRGSAWGKRVGAVEFGEVGKVGCYDFEEEESWEEQKGNVEDVGEHCGRRKLG